MATLTKSGSSFALGDLRGYDAWGNVLTGGSTGRPRGRYVANLGHVQDDESSLVYMRARYYEPGSGRFVSEDPARDGLNWFVYCANDPANAFDPDGKATRRGLASLATTLGFFAYFLATYIAGGDYSLKAFGAAAVTGLFKMATGEALTFLPQVFPTLYKVAAAFASAMSGGITAEGIRSTRLEAYMEFWIGYGMFLAFAIDCLDAVDNASGRWTPGGD